MDTEQQQEFKSVKPCTKPKRKVIPFNDHSIGARKPKKDKDRIGFVISNTTKGIKILYREKTKQEEKKSKKEKRRIIKMWNPVNFSDLHLTPKIMLL